MKSTAKDVLQYVEENDVKFATCSDGKKTYR